MPYQKGQSLEVVINQTNTDISEQDTVKIDNKDLLNAIVQDGDVILYLMGQKLNTIINLEDITVDNNCKIVVKNNEYYTNFLRSLGSIAPASVNGGCINIWCIAQ